MSENAHLIWLRGCAAAVRRLEAEAQTALYERHDEAAYRALMREKAELTAHLDEDAVPFSTCPESVRKSLARFAAGARNALRIGSVFYMSALLYPDDHQPGDPNNLERLIAELEKTPGK